MTKSFQIPKEELHRLYYIKGWTQRQIADHYGCTDSVIVRRMKEYGFQTRNRGDYHRASPSCTELRKLYTEQELSISQIAISQGCSETAVWRQLHKCNIEIRSQGGQYTEYIPSEMLATWPTPELAYAVGLIATDGHLGKGNNLIGFTSADKEQIKNYRDCLKLGAEVNTRVYPPDQENHKPIYRLNFSDRDFYAFLQELGLKPDKSTSMGALTIPNSVFADFARGCWDGDGCFSIQHRDGRLDQLRSNLTSSSPEFLKWVQKYIEELSGLRSNTYGTELTYYGSQAIALGHWLYYEPGLPALSRKRAIWEQFVT